MSAHANPYRTPARLMEYPKSSRPFRIAPTKREARILFLCSLGACTLFTVAFTWGGPHSFSIRDIPFLFGMGVFEILSFVGLEGDRGWYWSNVRPR